MTREQTTQRRLRQSLREAHPSALFERRMPSVQEVLRTNIPYLDAMIEETFRYSHIVPFTTRETIVDTQLLGHRIPRGTQVLFVTSDESFLKPAFPISQAQRLLWANGRKSDYGEWAPSDIADFKPERWLRKEQIVVDGVTTEMEVFDQKAGPCLHLGAGPRGCFGRRLVYLEMRIAVTLLLWRFEFLEVGPELNSFDAIDTSTEEPKDCIVKIREIID